MDRPSWFCKSKLANKTNHVSFKLDCHQLRFRLTGRAGASKDGFASCLFCEQTSSLHFELRSILRMPRQTMRGRWRRRLPVSDLSNCCQRSRNGRIEDGPGCRDRLNCLRKNLGKKTPPPQSWPILKSRRLQTRWAAKWSEIGKDRRHRLMHCKQN